MKYPERINNLTELADFLRTLPDNDDASAAHGFDMRNGRVSRDTRHPCGSAGCIGGWVCHINGWAVGAINSIQDIAPDIAFAECVVLCTPRDDEAPAWEATPQQAARAVEILRDTGKCDWPRAMREGV